MASAPEIPGYEILEPLGEGGMATVYLGVQKNFQRKVAVKILSARLLSDASFGVRFLREARIVAQLSHQNIVPVFDVGQHGDCHYIAMELLRGGDLKQRLAKGMPLSECLEITQQIASALHYASSKNFVHRDIKPENILFREDGSAVVSDFGIARSTESETNMTLTGTIIGTPSYMSPEQAQAQTLDGRSDLYSLGIILFEMLTGNVPFTADSAISIGLKHITDPIPELPDEVAEFQDLIDKALAKSPEDRFQTGQEFIDALDEIQANLQSGTESTTIISADALKRHKSASSRRRASGSTSVSRSRARNTTGGRTRSNTGKGRTALRNQPAAAGGSKKIILAASIVGVLALAGVGGWWVSNTESISAADAESLALKEQTLSLLDNANEALADGRLFEPADNNAQYYYTTALALAPMNQQAIDGIEALISTYLDSAQKSMGDVDEAAAAQWLNRSAQIAFYANDQSLLERQQTLRADLFQMQQQNIRQDQRQGQVELLLAGAKKALSENKLSSPIGDNAYDKYQSVLALDPENNSALEGIANIAATFLQQSTAEAQKGNFIRARALIAAAIQVDSQHPNLQVAQTTINDLEAKKRSDDMRLAKQKPLSPEEIAQQKAAAQKARIEQITGLLAGAAKDLQEDRLQSPAGNNAVAKFRSVLQLDPSNLDALEGLQKVGEKYVVLANAQLKNLKIDKADSYLNIAQKLVPNSQQLFAARRAVLDAREDRAIQRELELERQRQIKELLAAAKKDQDAGRLSAPLGNNALEKFSQVLVLDPINTSANSGRNKIVDQLVVDTGKAIKANQFDQAEAYIGTMSRFFPKGSKTRSLKNDLAKAKEVYARLQREKNGLLKRAERLAEKSPSDTNNSQLRAMYKRILEIESNNSAANVGLMKVGDYDLGIANTAIQARNYQKASLHINYVEQSTSDHPGLAAMKKRVEDAIAAQAEAEGLIESTSGHYAKAQKLSDDNIARNALKAVYRDILAAKTVDPGHPKITPALEQLEEKYVDSIAYYSEKKSFTRGKEMIEDALSMDIPLQRIVEQQELLLINEKEFKEKKKRLTRQMGVF
ncbi:serine/threonine protein kinase [Oceanicoccus sagamiensis]|uniref:non-specific serine/threonine protein kinase n=1 Tax=Oceanicoccus sagamiensis TaxID=716816 RepID=A0A1X9N840_9GAMM|nr:serine/threonine-protein kinase [Oceanicoccus sagamiensis]ARN74238.1 hypothetical protein BST96_08970 [Oceanicoccus sagamiensis]